MISLKELLDLWGFTDHPFDTYVAEKEARLADYFVAPPYLDDVLGTATNASTAVVFGARGIGKSAIRVYTERLCMTGDPKKLLRGGVLAITYDDFSFPLRDGLHHVTLGRHLEAILQKMVAGALARIVDRIDPQKPIEGEVRIAFPNLDLGTFGTLVMRYFVGLSEFQRQKALRGVYDYFKKVGSKEWGSWFQEVWKALRTPLFDVANAIRAVRGDALIDKAPPKLEEEAAQARLVEDFRTLAGMASQFALDAWYILIDKVDEDAATDSDATKSATMVAPLLKSLQVLETPGVAFKFFLWDTLRPILVEQGVRVDKLKNFRMEWTEAELREMISRRLKTFSQSAVADLTTISDSECSGRVYKEIFVFTENSPREAVHLLDSVFREHARHSDAANAALLTASSLDRGLDDYCTRRALDIFPHDALRALKQLNALTFTSSQVQSAFRISQPAASSKITRWVDNGYIHQIEDARSEKDPARKVFQYEIKDPRIRRIIQHGLPV